VAIGASIALAGFSAQSITRLLVLGFLAAQLLLRQRLVQAFPRLAPRARFIVMGTLLAAVVEGFHMISMPVLPALRIGHHTSLWQGAGFYAIDLLLTVPAYLVIFAVIWWWVNRYRFGLWQYVLLIGVAQVLGDGGIFFFLNAPAMLAFLPYPMTNYHAINVLPYLAVRDQLAPARPASAFAWLALPAVIATYLVCGTLIKLVARALGLDGPGS
jgi:hypothetical protein